MKMIIKIRRGPANTERKRRPLSPGEWVWLTDTKQLATGDGVSAEPLTGHYDGGLLTMLYQSGVAGASTTNKVVPTFAMPMMPLSVPAEILDTLVLEEGEVVYCPDRNWLYVGDGETKGGIRAS